MLSGFFGGDNQAGAANNNPGGLSDNWKNALQLLSIGLLAKGQNPDTPLMDIFAANQKMTEDQKVRAQEQQKQAALQQLASDMMKSPYLQDDSTRGMVRDLVAAGMPEKAYDYLNSLKPKPQEPFTLTPGSKRFDASGKMIAEVAQQAQKSQLQNALESAGYKPGTPEYKSMVDQYYKKQANQSAISPTGQLNPTKTVVTQNQLQIQAIDNVTPQLKELMTDKNIPGQLVGKYIHPSNQATYEAKTGAITDQLVSALRLPKTNESIALVQSLVTEKPMERRSDYIKRIDSLIKDLAARRKNATSILGNATIDNSSDSGESDDYETMAQEAIAAGADPNEVAQRMQQLKGY